MKALKWLLLFVLAIVGFLLFLILRGCGPLNEHPILGKVSLSRNGTSELPLNISRNLEQPWRLQFDGASNSLVESKIEVFLRNDDSDTLNVSINGKLGRVEIPQENLC